MDAELKCNRLTCRRPLSDKAVVTTCSHIFCVDCANELFNSARLCPACETSLTEPDDVVVCSLHPSNDYKTSVLSGLTPSIILEICSRAVSFWQYQIHQENSFQQAVIRNLNEKNSQLQKQLDNVVREANSEISLLNGKTGDLERDLEIERRKVRELQESSRERDKEYQKLKAQYDKIKRKALLAPTLGSGGVSETHTVGHDDHNNKRNFGNPLANTVDLGAIVGGMEANGVQRTPIGSRTMTGVFGRQRGGGSSSDSWNQAAPQQAAPHPQQTRTRVSISRRQPLQVAGDRAYRSGNVSDRSNSANEVENLLVKGYGPRLNTGGGTGWSNVPRASTNQRAFAPIGGGMKRTSGTFRPSNQGDR